jgi:hypothetical protein
MKRWIWSTTVIAAAACGPKPAATSIDNTSTADDRTPCPADATEAARAAWNVGEGSITVDCVAVRSRGETLWLLDGSFEEPDAMMAWLYSAVVTPAGAVRWASEGDEVPLGALMRVASTSWTAVDLDGDGDDEVLWAITYSHGGYDEEHLQAGKLGPSGFEVAGDGILVSHDNSAADPDDGDVRTCDGSYQVIDGPGGTRQVVVERTGEDCDPPGRAVYAWDGTALVAAP